MITNQAPKGIIPQSTKTVNINLSNVLNSLTFQVTVRFHTRQQLAVYDRFGRLIHGSEIIAKDVLEYIVFEKHLSNLYGVWRIHDKIIPDWAPPKDPSKLTKVRPLPEPVVVQVEEEAVQPAIADK